MSALLEIQNLTVSYGSVTALRELNLSVPDGKIVTLLGANGAGKSTTLRAISGLVKPESGDIRYQGSSLLGVSPHRIVGLGLIHCPEGRGLLPELNVEENLDLGAYSRPRSALIKAELAYVYELFPRLFERRKQAAGTLSGGEQQMLAMGRALMGKPRMLLLDEPSLGLAPQLVDLIFDAILKIHREGTSVLLVEQNAHLALEIAQEAYVLEIGQVSLSGKASVVAIDPKVQQAYLGG